jgi:tetratricopeptide (TPR) repeat protein
LSFFMGLAHYAAGAYEEAVRWGATAFAENPRYTATPKLLAAANAALGRTQAAAEALRVLLQMEPSLRLGPYMQRRQPFRDAGLIELYGEHLRRAGVPI